VLRANGFRPLSVSTQSQLLMKPIKRPQGPVERKDKRVADGRSVEESEIYCAGNC